MTAIPGIFHLPSLTNPGERIRLRGGPSVRLRSDFSFGIVSSLRQVELAYNLSDKEIARVKNDIREPIGVAWIGQFPMTGGLGGGVEGKMMAIAARIRAIHKKSVALFPIRTVICQLAELGWGADQWDYQRNPILDAEYLFLPDYQIDQGEGYLIQSGDQSRLARLLEYRRLRGLRTWLGIQNPQKLSKDEKQLVLGRYKCWEIENVTPKLIDDVASYKPSYPPGFYSVPDSGLSLEKLRQVPGFGYLFKK